MTAQLERKTLSMPKDAGYTQIPVLEKLTGAEEENFGHAMLKELLDNSLDAAESAGVAPEIEVAVGRAMESGDWLLTVTDNGPGIPADTVARLRDFSASTSDKAAYRSPTRGAQGNAWPCIISIPFALRARPSKVAIEAQGVHHTIWLEKVLGGQLDSHHDTKTSDRTTGTRVTIPLPAWLKLDVSRWVQDYVTVNPHLKAARARAGLSQKDLAERMRCLGYRKWVYQTVGKVENSARPLFAAEVLGLAVALDVSASALMSATEQDDKVELPAGQRIAATSVMGLAGRGVNDRAIRWDGNTARATAGHSRAPEKALPVWEAS